MEPITTRNLTKRYGSRFGDEVVTAVADLNLQVRKGEVLGFLGPNGAGKSTTIKMLTGLVHPTGGEVWIQGRNVREDPVRSRESLGYLPEVVGLYEEMTARQFLRYTGRFYGLNLSEITRRSEELLGEVSLEHAGSRRVGTYSKGMRQRLALAGALFHDPDVLVLDEPLTGLDPEGILKMRGVIRRLGEEKTIFLSSHELHAVEDLCDRVVIIRDGHVLADAPVEELTRPEAPRVRVVLEEDSDVADAVEEALAGSHSVVDVERLEGREVAYLLTLETGAEPARLLRELVERDVPVMEFRRETESLEDVFVRVTGVRPW